MQTLHEFMIVTKAVEYIMAAGFLVLFAFYWRFVFGSPGSSRTNGQGDKGHD